MFFQYNDPAMARGSQRRSHLRVSAIILNASPHVVQFLVHPPFPCCCPASISVDVQQTHDITPLYEVTSSQKRRGIARASEGSHSFTLYPRVYTKMNSAYVFPFPAEATTCLIFIVAIDVQFCLTAFISHDQTISAGCNVEKVTPHVLNIQFFLL